LVAALSDLAIQSAGELERAHEVLRQQWRVRQEVEGERFEMQAFVVSPTLVDGRPIDPCVEESIKECPRGVALQDLDRTIWALLGRGVPQDTVGLQGPVVKEELDQMDDSGEPAGGVRLDWQVDTTGDAELADPARLRYHQPVHISAEDFDDWQHLPRFNARSKRGNGPNSAQSIYDSVSRVLNSQPGYSVAECLPAEFRTRTPYSLALLGRIRQLVKACGGSMELVHDALRESYARRQAFEGDRYASTPFLVLNRPWFALPGKTFYERSIKECPRGIMVQDVMDAKSVIVKGSSAPSEHRNRQGETRADRLAKRRVNKESDAYVQ
jgi:hypothetical protein